MPIIDVNIMAVLLAVIANFIFGYVWYTPLFGKAWAKEMGMNMDVKPSGGSMARGMILMVIGNFLMAWVLSHDLAVWNPVTWGKEDMGVSAMQMAGVGSFFIWLGYYLPSDLSAVGWEGKSWKLFAINSGYHFLHLFIAAIIILNM